MVGMRPSIRIGEGYVIWQKLPTLPMLRRSGLSQGGNAKRVPAFACRRLQYRWSTPSRFNATSCCLSLVMALSHSMLTPPVITVRVILR
jgi:hypothetical protein